MNIYRTDHKIQSLGGQATAKKLRNQAIKRYYENPNKCLFCNKIIHVKPDEKVAEAKSRKFCDRACSSKFHGSKRKKVKLCAKCNTPTTNKYCSSLCRYGIDNKSESIVASLTKGELFAKRKNWQSARTAIRYHAAYTFKLFKLNSKCVVCGYDKHTDICHKTAVKRFSNSTTIKEINNPRNLVALCPNHHWEFDHGLIELE